MGAESYKSILCYCEVIELVILYTVSHTSILIFYSIYMNIVFPISIMFLSTVLLYPKCYMIIPVNYRIF